MHTSTTELTVARPTWRHVDGAQAVVFIATADSRPLAVIELRPGSGFHAIMCSGESLGHFPSLVDAQGAVDAWWRDHPRTAA